MREMMRWLQNSLDTRHICHKQEQENKNNKSPFLKSSLFTEYLFFLISPDVGEFGCPVHSHGILDEAIAAVEGQLLLWSPDHHGWYEGMGAPGTSRSLNICNVHVYEQRVAILEVEMEIHRPLLARRVHT